MARVEAPIVVECECRCDTSGRCTITGIMRGPDTNEVTDLRGLYRGERRLYQQLLDIGDGPVATAARAALSTLAGERIRRRAAEAQLERSEHRAQIASPGGGGGARQ